MSVSLLDLVHSDRFGDRVCAAVVLEQLALPAKSVRRRVERVELVASNINLRSTSVDLDLQSTKTLADTLGVEIDCLILSFVPKALMYSLSVKDSRGSSITVFRRDKDSRIAQCLLVGFALSREDGLPGLDIPNQPVWTTLYEHAYKLPFEHDSRDGLVHALSIGANLQGEDALWWTTACTNKRWRSWLLKFGGIAQNWSESRRSRETSRFWPCCQ